MKVLLMDMDSSRRYHYPNLALMKLSAFFKQNGDEVFLNFPLCQPDVTYASCVFSWNSKRGASAPDGAIVGGSGIDLKAELPPEVEHVKPDYTLYDVDYSIGFTSRGCPRKCPWCIVPDKEGDIVPWASIYEFWEREHRKIVLLDNNLLAAPNWRETLKDLIKEGLLVDFNQGLDIRLVNEENVRHLRQVKTKQLRFAFDHIAYEHAVRSGIELLLNSGFTPRELSFYVLVGFDSDTEDCIDRMKLLNSYNVDVYPMIYKDPSGREPVLNGLWDGIIFWHGARQNLRKFLRITGRLRT